MVQWKQIRLGTMRLRVRSLALLSGLRIQYCCELWCRLQMLLRSVVAVSCGVGHRQGSDLALLWLWCRLAATGPIRPLAWEPPYAMGAALERKEKKKERGRKKGRKRWYTLRCNQYIVYLESL